MKFEPTLITSFVAAAIALVVAFGYPVRPEQKEAIIEFVKVVVALFIASGIGAQFFTWPKATVEKLLAGDRDPSIMP